MLKRAVSLRRGCLVVCLKDNSEVFYVWAIMILVAIILLLLFSFASWIDLNCLSPLADIPEYIMPQINLSIV